MSFSASHVTNLNNSMSAAQDVALGTLINDLAGVKAASGSLAVSGSRMVVATGLTSVTSVVASLSGSPCLELAYVSATTGSVAGTIVINGWKPTSNSDTTPVAGSSTGGVVRWIAIGAY